MATSEPRTTQDRIHEFGVHDFELGDLLIDGAVGGGEKLKLTECPICCSDPRRPRYHFDEYENRPQHFVTEHNADEI